MFFFIFSVSVAIAYIMVCRQQ